MFELFKKEILILSSIVIISILLCFDVFWCKKILINNLTDYSSDVIFTSKAYNYEMYNFKTDILKDTIEVYHNNRDNYFGLNQIQTVYVSFFTEENYLDVIHDIELLPSVNEIVISSSSDIYWKGLDDLFSNGGKYCIEVDCTYGSIDFSSANEATSLKNLIIKGNEKSDSTEIYKGICDFPNLKTVLFYNLNTDGVEQLSNADKLTKVVFDSMVFNDLAVLGDCNNINELMLSFSEVGGISSPMDNISDLALFDCSGEFSNISNMINLSDLTVVRSENFDMSNLKTLTNLSYLMICGLNVVDISELSNCSNLVKLVIYNTKIEDISPLRNCEKLSTLSIMDTPINDISALKDIHNLQSLKISGTNVSDLSSIKDNENIKELDISNTKIVDLSGNLNFPNLEILNISNTDIISISELANCSKLSELDISNTDVSDLEALKNCPKLIKLDMGHTKITDISPLANCKELQNLNIEMTDVTDIEALSSCNAITKLNIDSTNVSDISVLEHCARLVYLDISRTPIKDISVIEECENLQFIDIVEVEIDDLSILKECTNLKFIDLDEFTHVAGQLVTELPNVVLNPPLQVKEYFFEIENYYNYLLIFYKE